MNCVLFRSKFVKEDGSRRVYQKIRKAVNDFNAKYRLAERPIVIETGGNDSDHWGAVGRYFGGEVPKNVFVLDFVKPKAALDTAYPVVKKLLAENGYISQFVNFKTYNHEDPRDERRSLITLGGVARQILHKAGVRSAFTHLLDLFWWHSSLFLVPHTC